MPSHHLHLKQEEDRDHIQEKPQVSCSLPVRKVRQNLYALDQKELPREMQILLQEVTRFFHSSSHPSTNRSRCGEL